MAPNPISMLLSWVGLFALFAALATANPVKHGDASFELSLSHLRVDNGLVPKDNLSVAAPANGCGLFCTADRVDTNWIIDAWEAIEYYRDSCDIPARTCRRLICNNTSAVYLCNDNIYEIHPYCNVVAKEARQILKECCGGGSYKAGISGQRFVPEQGWNVIVAYGNCNHDKYGDRPGIGPPEDPWGPNGSCFPP